METSMSILIGLGLAAACGFRIFLPMLVLSIASFAGHVTLAPAFAWIGTTPALIAFGAATVLEIAGYYIPWVDNILDTVATPAAVVAGTVVTASLWTSMNPFLQWSLAIIAGGGIAGIIQASTVAARAVSTVTSAGAANPVVATAELGMSTGLSVLAVIAPWLAMVAVIGLAGFVVVRIRRRSAGSQAPPALGHQDPPNSAQPSPGQVQTVEGRH
jgi:hypothetical protein